MPGNLPPPQWIDEPSALNSMLGDLKAQPVIAVDTESNSLYAYKEQVCLIQVSTRDTDYLIDPLALANLSSLGHVLSNPEVEKIFHAAEYDLICLKRDFGFRVSNIFDTRWAVRILGHKSDGLDRLLADKFDVQVNKKYQKADWGKRPLPREQVNYARLDTRYLLPLRDMLKTELEQKGLWQLASEDFKRACNQEIPDDRQTLWERVSYQNSLSMRELTLLKELELCREQIAEELDRPTFKVVSDKHLIEMAKNSPVHPDEMYGIGLSFRQVQRWGKDFLAALQKGREAPLVKRPHTDRPDEAVLTRLDRLKSWRKVTARKMGVESDVVLPRSLMELLAVEGPREINRLSKLLSESPWRITRFGGQIVSVLKGD